MYQNNCLALFLSPRVPPASHNQLEIMGRSTYQRTCGATFVTMRAPQQGWTHSDISGEVVGFLCESGLLEWCFELELNNLLCSWLWGVRMWLLCTVRFGCDETGVRILVNSSEWELWWNRCPKMDAKQRMIAVTKQVSKYWWELQWICILLMWWLCSAWIGSDTGIKIMVPTWRRTLETHEWWLY